jgi:hypothetical protein
MARTEVQYCVDEWSEDLLCRWKCHDCGIHGLRVFDHETADEQRREHISRNHTGVPHGA